LNALPENYLPPTAFVLDDDSGRRAALISKIVAAGVIAFDAGNLRELSHCDPSAPGCLVIVKRSSEGAALAVLDERREKLIDLPAVVAAEGVDVPFAIKAMKRGAYTVIDVNADSEALQLALLEAFAFDAEHRQLNRTRDALRRGLRSLSVGEREVLALIMAGSKNTAIAKRLGVSVRTVEVRRRSAYVKMGVRTAASMIAAVWQALDGDLSKLAPPPGDASKDEAPA
jgi:two-component system response regulator TtrR